MEPKRKPGLDLNAHFGRLPTVVVENDASMYNPPDYQNNTSHQNNNEEPEQSDEKVTDQGEEKQQATEEAGEPHCQINTKALPQHAKTYHLERFEKNALIILNHVHVEGYDTPRIGSEEDAAALERTFSKFGFEIERHDDLPKVEVFKKLKAFSSRDFTEYGCVAVAILTHGTNNGLLRANDFGQFYTERDVLGHFKTRSKPTLVTKPVMLMIQACRGTHTTRGMAVAHQQSLIHKDHLQDTDELEPYYLPLECDMLVVHSSYAGKPSYRPANGSWFIQTLCKRINELYTTHDLESIMLEMKREVAIDKYTAIYNAIADDVDINKQMPVVTSTLIRKLHLFDKSNPHDVVSVTTPAAADVFDGPKAGSSCDCYLDHFDYMKQCLSIIVHDNPKDNVAKHLLKLASEEVNNEMTKSLLALISAYFKKHCHETAVHKFMHFYEDSSSSKELDALELRLSEASDTHLKDSLKNIWLKWSQSLTVRSIGVCVGAWIMYNLVTRLK